MATGTALFAALLILTVVAHQLRFPPEASAYPFGESDPRAWSTIALILTLLLSPLVVLDFYVMARQVCSLEPSDRALGAGFGLGGVFLAAVIFSQIFTTTYDYVPLIGPVFRDKFWAVLATPALVLVIALMASPSAAPQAIRPSRALVAGMSVLAFIALGGALYVQARPGLPPGHGSSLTVITYNVQQGYSGDGRRNFEGQVAVLRSLNADVIGLQESDTNRVAGGNDDLVRYFADHLNLYSYSGPKAATGTFGIALLSRYPIENPRTFYLFSEGEQTAAISAQITVNGKTFDLLVTHLGNGGPLEQQQEVLNVASRLSNVVLIGDFNFRRGSAQYLITQEHLEDAWIRRWPAAVDDAGNRASAKIDHVFVSPGTTVLQAKYVESPASDHSALIVEIGP